MDLLTLVVAGAVTWLLRASFVVGPAGTRALPSWTDSLIGHLRPAILGALVASTFVSRAGGDVGSIPPSWIVAGLLITVVGSRKHGLTVSAGTGLGLIVVAATLGIAV